MIRVSLLSLAALAAIGAPAAQASTACLDATVILRDVTIEDAEHAIRMLYFLQWKVPNPGCKPAPSIVKSFLSMRSENLVFLIRESAEPGKSTAAAANF